MCCLASWSPMHYCAGGNSTLSEMEGINTQSTPKRPEAYLMILNGLSKSQRATLITDAICHFGRDEQSLPKKKGSGDLLD